MGARTHTANPLDRRVEDVERLVDTFGRHLELVERQVAELESLRKEIGVLKSELTGLRLGAVA